MIREKIKKSAATGFLILSLLMAGKHPGVAQETAPANRDAAIEQAFMNLTRESEWHLTSAERLPFPTWHTQGMTLRNETWFLTTVEIEEQTRSLPEDSLYDRTAGMGRAHLILFDNSGAHIQTIDLSDGNLYHPGGIDSDERYVWVSIAEYRPDSRSVIYKVDTATLEVTELFRFPDHIGALIRDDEQNRLIGYSWGSRRIYVWDLDESGQLLRPEQLNELEPLANPQHYIDYQDCQFLGRGKALCSGLSNYVGPQGTRYPLGGIHLIELETFRPVWQLPVEQFTEGIRPRVMTQNPFYAEMGDTGIRFHFIPEDDESLHYIFEVVSGLE
ncbi:MAG: hypothetical protein EA360_10485 [Balneolaceae bacterium]|nr:MAG: hypothetical protein EA360_10485 [Balneolaceae bacterium]